MKEKNLTDAILRQITFRLPGRFLYFCLVAAFVRATTGKWSHVDSSKVTLKDIMDRL